jgi:hypothetical protein
MPAPVSPDPHERDTDAAVVVDEENPFGRGSHPLGAAQPLTWPLSGEVERREARGRPLAQN